MKMPVTYKGLRKYDDLPALEAVVKAWTTLGRNPRAHLFAQDKVRDLMPVMARALDRVNYDDQEVVR